MSDDKYIGPLVIGIVAVIFVAVVAYSFPGFIIQLTNSGSTAFGAQNLIVLPGVFLQYGDSIRAISRRAVIIFRLSSGRNGIP